METPISFGEWLRQRRKTLDMTQEELARRVGCSVSALRKIEAGERRPSRQVAERLAETLAILPEDRALFLKVARGERAADRLVSVPPAAESPSRKSAPRLPLPPTPLIGRAAELAEIARLLDDPQCRLLTLVGPGGIGKTRLAIAAATDRREAFADGAYFVSLAPVSSAEFIVPAIADALALAFYGPTDPTTQLLNYLRDAKRHLLLVLDNLEHLLDGVGLLGEISRQAPNVKLLVTSRERLSLHGEWVFEIQGLPFPDSARAAGFADYGAVALFIERARRAHVGFGLTAEAWPAVARICQLIEGMPLGIELAAAWVRTLSCHEIAQEIERNLADPRQGMDFLAASIRDVPARHRSMRAAFDHSWNLLSAEEQRVLRQLSVFRGGFRREAAEQAVGATLLLLSALVDKSLLHRTAEGRYDLHELVRQYAAAKLQDDPQEYAQTHDRHSGHYTALLQQREPLLKSATQPAILEELSAEIDNLRLAWDWAVVHDKPAEIRQAVRTLNRFYDTRDWFQEGAAVFERAVKTLQGEGESGQAPGKAHAVALGQALAHQGWFYFRLGRIGEARDLLQRSLALLRPYDDRTALADTLVYLGHVTHLMGDYPEGRQLLQEGLALYRAIGDEWSAAMGLISLGTVALAQGEYQEAQRVFRERLAAWDAIGYSRGRSLGLSYVGAAARALGEYTEAQQLLHESLALARETGDRYDAATALNQLGLVAYALGEYAQAQRLLRDSIALFKEIGDRWSMAGTLDDLGKVSFALSAYDEAKRYFLEALKTAIEAQTVPLALDTLVGLATLLSREGTIERALELLAHVLNHPASMKETRDRAERLRAEWEAQLTPQQVEAVQARAQARTFKAIVEEILKGER